MYSLTEEDGQWVARFGGRVIHTGPLKIAVIDQVRAEQRPLLLEWHLAAFDEAFPAPPVIPWPDDDES